VMPKEILSHLLSYLGKVDMHLAVAVNKVWLQAVIQIVKAKESFRINSVVTFLSQKLEQKLYASQIRELSIVVLTKSEKILVAENLRTIQSSIDGFKEETLTIFKKDEDKQKLNFTLEPLMQKFIQEHDFEALDIVDLVPNIITYNMLLQSCVNQENLEGIKEVFNRMEEAELKPDQITCNIMLHFHIEQENLEETKAVFNGMQGAGFELDVITSNTLLNFYVNQQDLEGLEEILIYMQRVGLKLNKFICNPLLNFYVNQQDLDRVKKILICMQKAKIMLDKFTCDKLLNFYVKKEDLEGLKEILIYMQRAGFEPNIAVTINMLSRIKRMRKH
jgi:pentatricopeptide repeat protein